MAHKLGGNFLWFAEADVEESQDALMVPASASRMRYGIGRR